MVYIQEECKCCILPFSQDGNAFFEVSFMNKEDAEAYELVPNNGTGSVAVNIVANEIARLDYERPENRRQVMQVCSQYSQTSIQCILYYANLDITRSPRGPAF